MPEFTQLPYLKVGDYVFLEGRWRETAEGGYLQDALIKITATQTFPYWKSYVIQQGQSYDVILDNSENGIKLYPDEMDTLYEIGVGIKGKVELHIKIPSDRYYHYLEKIGSTYSLSDHPEIGGLTEEDIPIIEPKRMREYTLKYLRDTIKYQLVNNSYKDEKVILDFTVNKTKFKIIHPETDEYKYVKEHWDELIDAGILRVVKYPREGW